MGYELAIPLKGATLEIEFDSVDELEQKLADIDLSRVEKLLSQARRRKPAAKKRAAKKGAAKQGAAKKGTATKTARKKGAAKKGARKAAEGA